MRKSHAADVLNCTLLMLIQLKDRVNSYRGRIRDRIELSIAGAYDLDSKSGQELIDHVEWLLEKHFYKKVSTLLGYLI
jgi:hypothetical protein